MSNDQGPNWPLQPDRITMMSMHQTGSRKSILVRRGIRRGILNVVRERGWATTFGALFGIVMVTQLLLVSFIGVRGIEQLLRSQTDLRLEIRNTANDKQIQEIFGAMRELPSVESVRYVTKEQAFEQERLRDPKLIEFLEQFNLENPFPDTFSITLRSLDEYESFAVFAKDARWTAIIDPNFLSETTTQEQEVHEMLRLTGIGRGIVTGFICLMLLALLLVIVELVRRRALARGEEILVERLVGAQNTFILLPFATEGTLLLVIAFLVSSGLLIGFLFALPFISTSLFQGGTGALAQTISQLLYQLLPLLLAIQLLLSPLLGFAGAWLGMRRQLKTSQLVFA